MTRAWPLLAFVLAAVLAGAPELSFSEEAKLQHDPFARPALGSLQRGSKGGPAGNGKAAAAEPRRRLNLQAGVIAGPQSIAQFHGIMVRLSDQGFHYSPAAVPREPGGVQEKNKRVTA